VIKKKICSVETLCPPNMSKGPGGSMKLPGSGLSEDTSLNRQVIKEGCEEPGGWVGNLGWDLEPFLLYLCLANNENTFTVLFVSACDISWARKAP
jgi:hypothetical protein